MTDIAALIERLRRYEVHGQLAEDLVEAIGHLKDCTAELAVKCASLEQRIRELEAENERLSVIEHDRDAVCDSYAAENQRFHDRIRELEAALAHSESEGKEKSA